MHLLMEDAVRERYAALIQTSSDVPEFRHGDGSRLPMGEWRHSAVGLRRRCGRGRGIRQEVGLDIG